MKIIIYTTTMYVNFPHALGLTITSYLRWCWLLYLHIITYLTIFITYRTIINLVGLPNRNLLEISADSVLARGLPLKFPITSLNHFKKTKEVNINNIKDILNLYNFKGSITKIKPFS